MRRAPGAEARFPVGTHVTVAADSVQFGWPADMVGVEYIVRKTRAGSIAVISRADGTGNEIRIHSIALEKF